MTIHVTGAACGGLRYGLLKKKGGTLLQNPPEDHVLEEGDRVVALSRSGAQILMQAQSLSFSSGRHPAQRKRIASETIFALMDVPWTLVAGMICWIRGLHFNTST